MTETSTPATEVPGLAAFLRPPNTRASRDYVHEVDQRIGHAIVPGRTEEVADFIAAEVERVGGSDARLVFTADDGTGPYCSWCWRVGGLCAHIAGGQSEHVKEAQ